MKKDLLILKMYAIKRRKNSHLANSAPFLSEKDPIQRCLEIRLQLTLFPWLFDTILSNISKKKSTMWTLTAIAMHTYLYICLYSCCLFWFIICFFHVFLSGCCLLLPPICLYVACISPFLPLYFPFASTFLRCHRFLSISQMILPFVSLVFSVSQDC